MWVDARGMVLVSTLVVAGLAGRSAADGSFTPDSTRHAVGVSIGTPSALNAVLQYDPGRMAFRLSGMYYGAIRGVQLSAIPVRASLRKLQVGIHLAGGYAAVRHGVGPFSTEVTDEISYLGAGAFLAWRGAFLEPGAWWGRSTTSSRAGPLLQIGYLRALR